jgi:hypothetical protein
VTIAVINLQSDPDLDQSQIDDRIAEQYRIIQQLDKAQSKSDYQVEKLLEAAKV